MHLPILRARQRRELKDKAAFSRSESRESPSVIFCLRFRLTSEAATLTLFLTGGSKGLRAAIRSLLLLQNRAGRILPAALQLN
jgi:hypothetical protein